MKKSILVASLTVAIMGTANAHEISSPVDPAKKPAFDITSAKATTDGRMTTFAMELAGAAGSIKPVLIGQLAGAKVEAYVWPTSMNPSKVGFDADSGILALVIIAHPDFDDTPLYDENRDGNPANDGADWHSHWVVLAKTDACGAGLKVRDVSPGQDLLPATARITVPIAGTEAVSFDAVTAELQINVETKAPLLCVTGVHDIASGDLSLPGKVMTK
jgi:hypothetical protein